MTKDRQQLEAAIAELEPQVAGHIARGGAVRPLTAEENRLALTDPAEFDRIVQGRQEETLDLLRKTAALETLRADLDQVIAAETLEERQRLETDRARLLEARHGAASDLEAALVALQESLEEFMRLNGHISDLDRRLGTPDASSASHGMVALRLKRAIHAASPQLARLAGIPFVAPRPGESLADSFDSSDPLNS